MKIVIYKILKNLLKSVKFTKIIFVKAKFLRRNFLVYVNVPPAHNYAAAGMILQL